MQNGLSASCHIVGTSGRRFKGRRAHIARRPRRMGAPAHTSPPRDEGAYAARRIDCGRALVAELVDALVSGISNRKVVGVRVPSWA